MKAEQITDPIAYHGEGPVWSSSWGGLRWVDMLAGDFLTLRGESVERTHVSEVVAAVRPRKGGGAVIGIERGFALEAPDGTITKLPEVWSDTSIRMNEGGCDPEGRFWCGSMAYDQEPGAASVYRLDAEGNVEIMLEDVTVSNGIEWSPDGSQVYYNDTATFQVAVFDYSPEHGLGERRVFADLGDGRPDGLTVDSEGGVWVAISNGGQVRRYHANGTLDEVIEVPASKTTACTLGGEGLTRLFVTTSQENINTEEDPLAGALFAVDVDVRGVEVREFAG